MIYWVKDKQEYDASTERQRLIELNLVKQLTTEHLDNEMKVDEKKLDSQKNIDSHHFHAIELNRILIYL